MTSYRQFTERCKMRYDFDDQIQVRYQHTDGEFFDTWVSGEEVLSRLKSIEAEERLRAIKNLNLDALRRLAKELPKEGKERAWSTLRDRLADSVEDTIGGNVVGDGLADAVREGNDDSDVEPERQRWLLLLHDRAFKTRVLELAWIQLEGSFPDDDLTDQLNDWV